MTKAEVKHRDIFNGNILRNYRIVTSIMKGNYFVGERAGKFTIFRAVIKDNRFQIITIGTECHNKCARRLPPSGGRGIAPRSFLMVNNSNIRNFSIFVK